LKFQIGNLKKLRGGGSCAAVEQEQYGKKQG
jgi:hypothetical protein